MNTALPSTPTAAKPLPSRRRSGAAPSADADRHKVAYILAPSHSGSTLLAMLLGAHPEVCSVGELKLTPSAFGRIQEYHCSCGARILECPFWSQIAHRIHTAGLPFSVGNAGTDFRRSGGRAAARLLRMRLAGPFTEWLRDLALACSPTWRREHAFVHTRYAALVGALLAETGARVVVDSSKVAVQLKFLLRNPALDLRVIRLLRDGRAVALTYMNPGQFADARDPQRRGGGNGRGSSGPEMSIRTAALAWRRNIHEAECLLRTLPADRYVEVRYEDLCTNPGTTLQQLFSFLGISSGQSAANFRARSHHVVGNGMRFDTASEIRLDERWRSTLSACQLADFDQYAGAANSRCGYLRSIRG